MGADLLLAEQARLSAEADAEQARLDAEADADLLLAEQARLATDAEQARLSAEADVDLLLAEQAEARAQHSSAFAELSATATWTASGAPGAAREPEAAEPDDRDDDPPVRSYGAEDTDMAALLRELASLGLDGDPPPGRTPGVPPRPPMGAGAAAAARKRKGLFGRS